MRAAPGPTPPEADAANAAPASHWASLSESTFVVGIRLLFWIYRCFGALPFKLCLYPVVTYYWATNRPARQASLEYLEHLQASQQALGHAPTWRDSWRHFLAFAETILDKLLAMNGQAPPIHKEGTEGLLALLAQQRGAIIMTGHVGCLELCQLSAEQNQRMRRLNVLVHTAHAEKFNRLLRKLQPNSPVELIQVRSFSTATALMLAQKVAQGEFIAIAGDRIPVGSGMTTTAEFLGELAPFPCGAYVLAATLKCPLYAMACIREPYLSSRYRYTMHTQLIAEQVVLARAQRQAAMAGYARQYAQWLERIVAQSPLAWFNFFHFWQQPSHRDAPPPSSSPQP